MGGQNGGGGAGLGGGLFVAGPNATAVGAQTTTAGGNVTLTNVNFTGTAARGGAGGGRADGTITGGGGLDGGAGGSTGNGGNNGGGGVGFSATGAALGNQNGSANGGPGIILGAASGGNAGTGIGGANGGGGAVQLANGTFTVGSGGVGGGTAVFPNRTSGGFGGGGGVFSVGGFGGGGGGSFTNQGTGGFGGGGGGGSTNAGGFGGGGGTSAGGGGGGLGAGADVFVQQGGQLTIAGTSNLNAGTVTGGTGAAAGSAFGSGFFIQGNQSVTITPGAGNTTTVSGVIADQTGSGGTGANAGAGNLVIGAGTTALTAANTYTGGTTLNAGSNFSLSAPTSAGTGAIAFAGTTANPGQLTLQTGAQNIGGTFGNRLDNFTGTNSLDLRGFAYNGQTAYTATNNTLTITGGTNGTQTQTFRLQNGAASYIASSDGAGGTLVRQVAPTPTQPTNPTPAPCYVTGTRIRILRGHTIQDVPVERLLVGDLAITASGKPRPIRWIGTRSYPGFSAPKHDRPVRIRAGALADGMPARDLLISPDHCLWLDGLFVAAGHLSNGTSIVRGEAVADLTYWHVELDSHDLLVAENTPAESFLAAPGVRAGFDGVDADDAVAAPVPYAPRAERHTPEMDALRERLIRRAGLSVEPLRFGAVRAWLDVCDGTRIAGWARDDAHPDAPVCLDILVDGEVVALALAQDHRADLAAAGMGDGRHGFDIELDAPLVSGVAHTVEVRRSADGLRVAAMAVDAAGAWTALLAA